MTKTKPRYDGYAQSYPGALPGPWADRAACIGLPSDIFYPDAGRTPAQAKAICNDCPVRIECADFALTTGERHGVWGALSEPERDRLLHRRPRSH